MHVLITGGAGFIGSHICDRLHAAGHRLTIVDDLSLGRAGNLTALGGSDRVRFHELSILDEGFAALFESDPPDCVFHMAANSDISAGSSNRRIDLDRTFLTTWTVLECMARHGTRQLVFASTSAIYGDVADPTDEDYGPLQPVSFYGAAKLASEAYCSAYAHRHGIATWTFRFPNVVGPRATHGVILDFITRLQARPEVLQVLGNGEQCKPYLYVHDLVDAMLHAWQRAEPAPLEVFNLGPHTATRVKTIAETVVETMGLSGRTRIEYGESAVGWPGDVPRFAYDTGKIEALGWSCDRTSDMAVAQAAADILAERSE